MSQGMIQYVLVRGDLRKSWPLGAIIAQACHACTAIIFQHKDDENVIKYTSDIDNMHKCVLEIKSEEQMKNLSQTLIENGVDHKLWVEQPENFPTCIAVKPYPKADIQKYFKKYNLLK